MQVQIIAADHSWPSEWSAETEYNWMIVLFQGFRVHVWTYLILDVLLINKNTTLETASLTLAVEVSEKVVGQLWLATISGGGNEMVKS